MLRICKSYSPNDLTYIKYQEKKDAVIQKTIEKTTSNITGH